MIAGPNGAGKTTTAVAFLSQQKNLYEEFLNADHIAQGLSPLHPESVNLQAAKLMIERFHACLNQNISFAFETTASGLTYAKHLSKAKENGYEINLIYLWLPSSEQAVKRVAQRVKQGGHNIPTEVIIQRYYRGLKNLFNLYLPLANTVLILDNSSAESGIRKIIAKKNLDLPLQIEDQEIWDKLQRSTNDKA